MKHKGVRVALKINGQTYVDLHSHTMQLESELQGGGIVHHAWGLPGGNQVVLEFHAEDLEDYCDDEGRNSRDA